jgi:hypothetical protein
VSEDLDTAEALRAVSHLLTADDFLVVSGDLVCDVPVGAVAAAHRRQGALVTALLWPHPSTPNSETASGDKTKQPTTFDIIGLNSTHQHLLYVSTGMQVSLIIVSQLVFIPLRCLGIVFFPVLRSLIGLEVCSSTLSFSMNSLLTLQLLSREKTAHQFRFCNTLEQNS